MDLIFIISFIATIFLLIYAIGYVLYITRKDREFEKKRSETYYNSAQILNATRQKAGQILEESETRAHQILSQAINVQKDIENDFNQTLKLVVDKNSQEAGHDSQQMLADYKNSLTQLKNQYLVEIEGIIKEMEGSMKTEFSQFKTVLENDTKQAENTLGQNLSAELEKTKIELETYKKEQIKKIDEMIRNTVFRISQEVLAKTISPQEHERLIIEALDQAKKEGVFN